MESDVGSQTKYFISFPTPSEIERARHVFITRFAARFVQKHKKYVTLLMEHGVAIPETLSTFSFCVSFEDEIDIIVSEKRQKIKDVCKIKGVYSIKNLFGQIYQIVRRTRAARIYSKLQDISKEDLIETLNDIGSELAIAYEYQIVMLNSENDVRQLADHAVSCTMNFLKQSDASFNRCQILEAITDVLPRKSFTRGEKVVTRIMKTDHVKSTRRQKWRLSEIFKQPGLRMHKTDGTGYDFYGCFTPYGSSCRPEKYGFRGPIHVWDDNLSQFVLLYNDKISVNDKHGRKIEQDTNNIHQNYEPAMLCLHSESNTTAHGRTTTSNNSNLNDDIACKVSNESTLLSSDIFNSEPVFQFSDISTDKQKILDMSTNEKVSPHSKADNMDIITELRDNPKGEHLLSSNETFNNKSKYSPNKESKSIFVPPLNKESSELLFPSNEVSKCNSVFPSYKEYKCDAMSLSNEELKCNSASPLNEDFKCDSVSPSDVESKCDAVPPSNEESKCDAVFPSNEDFKCDSIYASNEEIKCDSVSPSNEDFKCDAVSLSNEESECNSVFPSNEKFKCDTVSPSNEKFKRDSVSPSNVSVSVH